MFINHVVNCSTRDNVINLFADDVLSTVSGSTPADVKVKLDNNVAILADWYKKNRLVLHPKKTKFMMVGSKQQLSMIFDPLSLLHGSSNIAASDFVEYLGVHLQPDLSFDLHIKEVIRKLNYQASILKNLAN